MSFRGVVGRSLRLWRWGFSAYANIAANALGAARDGINIPGQYLRLSRRYVFAYKPG
jgi:hypothetical protein